MGGCERGCLSTWLGQHGAGTTTPASSAAPDLGGTDCTEGLARCVDGTIELSRTGHVPEPCHGPASVCNCPWVRAEACARGCAAEGVTVDLPADAAVLQLCRPGAELLARPPSAAPPSGVCDGERRRCVAGLVVSCEPSVHATATCARGCARDGQEIDDEISDEAAVALLCAR